MGGAGDVRGRRAGSTCRGGSAQDRSGDRDAGTPVVRAGKGVKDRLSRLVAALLDGAVAAYRRRVRRSAPPGYRRHGRLRRGAHGVLRSVGRALWTDAERAWLGMRRRRGCELQIAAQREEVSGTVCEGPIGGAKALYGGTRSKCYLSGKRKDPR